MANGLRGWKWHPAGGSSGEGISPASGANRCFFASIGGDFVALLVVDRGERLVDQRIERRLE
jgi:hypothetical protein